MATKYIPELGHVLYSQTWQEQSAKYTPMHSAVNYIGSLLDDLSITVYDPTANYGQIFDAPTFSIHGYSWGADDQGWNFKWRDYRMSWYKHSNRGTTHNREHTAEEALEFVTEAIAHITSLLADRKENNNK